VSWTKSYDCRIEKQDTERWYLLATPKPGVESDYAKALVWVDKKTFTQVGVEYFNAKGEKVKVFSNSEMKDFQGVPRATLVVLSDPRTGHKTELHIRGFKYNQGLKDEMFTVRQLQWGK
jgi:outer membrane lipoprotein-sorting protein